MTELGLLAPPDVVDPPKQEPAFHSLLATATEVTEQPVTRMGMPVEQWGAGFRFKPEACDDGGVWIPCVTEKPADLQGGSGSGDVTQLKSQFNSRAPITFIPYVIEGSFTCSTTGFEAADYVGHAERHLSYITPKQVEHEFWTGAQMDGHPTGVGNMALVKSTPTEGVMNAGGAAAPTAVDYREAMALLQQGLANCAGGGRGTIHATPYVVAKWNSDHLLQWDGQNRLITSSRADYVVAGAGYPGTGPNVAAVGTRAATATKQWVYATGIVNWRIGRIRMIPGASEMPDVLAQAIARNQNEVEYIAERFAAAVWDTCCTVAVLVDTTLKP